jgi:hypothetical protein
MPGRLLSAIPSAFVKEGAVGLYRLDTGSHSQPGFPKVAGTLLSHSIGHKQFSRCCLMGMIPIGET